MASPPPHASSTGASGHAPRHFSPQPIADRLSPPSSLHASRSQVCRQPFERRGRRRGAPRRGTSAREGPGRTSQARVQQRSAPRHSGRAFQAPPRSPTVAHNPHSQTVHPRLSSLAALAAPPGSPWRLPYLAGEWPAERKLRSDPKRRNFCRKPAPLKEFQAAREALDARLQAVSYTHLTLPTILLV